MYESYWQLERNPFDDAADLGSYFPGDTHQAALLKLRYVIENGKGAALLGGETGVGKSFLLQVLSRQLADPYRPFAHLVFPQMAAAELLAYLAVELGATGLYAGTETVGVDRTVREIDQRLGQLNAEGCRPVIVIDEAHLIDDWQVFQAMRLLLNFQQGAGRQFTLIFAGQNELFTTIHRMGQLEERLAVKCQLRPLTLDETSRYVASRLAAAGAQRSLFAADSLALLHELSGGIPRRINRLCDLALLVGFADELHAISARQIEAVAEELFAVIPD
ncbi:MAG: AAA family ATPase [Planctomycetes bacterium]|nr:AAA family ATPase [Planctomycetota bacterium]